MTNSGLWLCMSMTQRFVITTVMLHSRAVRRSQEAKKLPNYLVLFQLNNFVSRVGGYGCEYSFSVLYTSLAYLQISNQLIQTVFKPVSFLKKGFHVALMHHFNNFFRLYLLYCFKLCDHSSYNNYFSCISDVKLWRKGKQMFSASTETKGIPIW